jgi:hypothetical protein
VDWDSRIGGERWSEGNSDLGGRTLRVMIKKRKLQQDEGVDLTLRRQRCRAR